MPRNLIIGKGKPFSKPVTPVLAESRLVEEENTIQEATRTEDQQADAEAVQARPASQTGTPARKLSLYELREYRADVAIELSDVIDDLNLLKSLKPNRRDNALVKKLEKQVKELRKGIANIDNQIESQTRS